MNRDLPHLVSQVFNAPLMIHGEKLDTILSVIGPRILTGQEIAAVAGLQPRADMLGGPVRFTGGGYLADGGIAVLPVLGTLVRRGSYLDALSGMTSYVRIEAALAEMVAHPSVHGVMLEIDSYGGEAGGVFDLVARMADISGEREKPIWASVNETAASAGYAVACAAENIWLPQMGAVGSVGVVTAHVDMSKADAATGLKWTYVFNGDYKIDGNSHEPLPADVKARVQADVDDIAAKFHDLVAQARGMSAESVRATKAGMFRGAKAIEAGLADNLGTFADAMNAFAAHLSSISAPAGNSRRLRGLDQTRSLAMPKSPAAVAPTVADPAVEPEPAALSAALPALPASVLPTAGPEETSAAAAIDAAVAAATARASDLTAIGQRAAKLGVEFDVAKAISDGVLPEVARAQVLEAAAAASESLTILNRTTSHTADAANIAAGWGAALASVAARRGLPLAG